MTGLVYPRTPPGDAYPLPRPTGVYDFDRCDETTLAVLATIAEIRDRIINSYGGSPTGKALCRILDAYAAEIINDNSEDNE